MHSAGHKLIGPMLVATVAVSLAGCYTLLKHADVSEDSDKSDLSRSTDCHSSCFHPAPYDPIYADPWWNSTSSRGGTRTSSSFLAAPRGTAPRMIVQREAARRDGSGVGMNPLGGIGAPATTTKELRDAGGSGSGKGEIAKKYIGGDSKADKRAIEDRNVTRRGNEDNAADAKSTKSTDEKDAAKDSDKRRDSNEEKKGRP